MALSLQKVSEWKNSFADFLERPPRIFRLNASQFSHIDFFVTKISVRIVSLSDPMDWIINCMYNPATDYIDTTWSVISNYSTTAMNCNATQAAHALCDAIVIQKSQVQFEVDIQFVSTLDVHDVERWDEQTRLKLKKAKIEFEQSSFNSSLFQCCGSCLRYVYDFSKGCRVKL